MTISTKRDIENKSLIKLRKRRSPIDWNDYKIHKQITQLVADGYTLVSVCNVLGVHYDELQRKRRCVPAVEYAIMLGRDAIKQLIMDKRMQISMQDDNPKQIQAMKDLERSVFESMIDVNDEKQLTDKVNEIVVEIVSPNRDTNDE